MISFDDFYGSPCHVRRIDACGKEFRLGMQRERNIEARARARRTERAAAVRPAAEQSKKGKAS